MKSLVFAAALLCAAPALAAPVDRVVAVVNGEAILSSDLVKARRDLEKENVLAARDEKLTDRELLQRLIDDKLANQEAVKLNIEVSEKEVDSAVDDVLMQNRLDADALKQRLAEQGMTFPEYRKKIEEQIRRLKLTNRAVRSRVVIDQSRMQAYYSQHREEFKDTAKLRLMQAVFAGAGAVSKANAIYQKGALTPEEFEAAATDSSVSGVKDLGVLSPDRMDPEVARLIAPVEAGHMAPPMQAGPAVQLIYVRERMPARIKSFEEVRGEIEDRLGREETERQFAKWLKELRDKSLVEIKL